MTIEKLPVTLATACPEETEAVGAALALYFKSNNINEGFVAMRGDLGAGKTAFTRGFASVFCPKARVKSPTFAIVNVYRGETVIHHLDTYRITDDDDLYSTGFYDYIEKKNAVCVTEWSEKIPYALPDRYFKVTIEKNNIDIPDSRKITVELINS